MKWNEIIINTTNEAVEAITNILYECGANGSIIDNPKDFQFSNKKPLDWDYVDKSLLDRGKSRDVIIKGYISEEKNLKEFIDVVRHRIMDLENFDINIGKGTVTVNTVNEEDWANSWKSYYKPTKIGNKIVVKPTWEDYNSDVTEIVVELDPGMAFGTGTHETTSMCVNLLEKYVTEGSEVFDIGCGSGILAITAAKLGAKKIIAVDLDEVAVMVSKENVIKNRVYTNVEVKYGNLTEVIDGKADIVVSNIIANMIEILSKNISNYLKPQGVFIASGVILEKLGNVKEALIDNGFEIIEVIKKGDWAAIVSKKTKYDRR